jgi:hypothetical protein
MSVVGQKRTWRDQISMSALPSKADIRPRDQDVCFGPKADSCSAAKYVLHSITSSARPSSDLFLSVAGSASSNLATTFCIARVQEHNDPKARVISIAFGTRMCGPAEQARYGPRVGNKTLCLRKPSRASHDLLFVMPSMRVRIVNGE